MSSSQLAVSESAFIEITEHGAIVNGSLTQHEWVSAITTLRDVHRNYLKALGDVVGYGIANFGEKVVGAHIEQLEFDLAEANTALGISTLHYNFKEAYPLTPACYYALSKLSTEELKEEWAKIAVKHKLSALELKRSIEAGEILTTENISKGSGLGSGITTIEGTLFQFNQWKQRVGEDKIIELPQENRIALLEKLGPIVELAEKLHDSLEKEDR
jgi:hypothetical protein